MTVFIPFYGSGWLRIDPLEHVKVGSDIQYRVSITIAVTTHILCTESYVCLPVGKHRERP